MNNFQERLPTLDNYWRAIILFGHNVASYKFALGKSLLEVADEEQTFIPLDELAEPYSRHICAALERCDTQITSPSSRFLDACRAYNTGGIGSGELIDTTVRLGFNNVIDAFHNVNRDEVPERFFMDERDDGVKGIRLTDEIFQLAEHVQFENLKQEVDARWRLVETAWDLNLPKSAITVRFDEETYSLFTDRDRTKRRDITGSRDALNGYQKGKCFYCFDDIAVQAGAEDLCEVDHFFPHVLKQTDTEAAIDGVWNLVLACQRCNQNKSARVPSLRLLERLNTRNEFFISSHHPLRETIIQQTGTTTKRRQDFLQRMYDHAVDFRIHKWEPFVEFEDAY